MPEDQHNRNVPVVYANNVRLAMSFSDFKLFFGEAVPPPPTTTEEMVNVPVPTSSKPIDRVCIVMSPDLIPSLAAGLQNAVQTYQSNFGPLRTPPQKPPVAQQLPNQ